MAASHKSNGKPALKQGTRSFWIGMCSQQSQNSNGKTQTETIYPITGRWNVTETDPSRTPQRRNETMLKVHILVRRRSDMTHEQCVAYWRDVHAPLYTSQPDVKRYVRHYIQCFITGDRPAGPNLGDTDGIVELWFDNIDGFNAFANSPLYLNVIKLDEERFHDPKKSEYFFSEERTIIK
jgi:hypothetical protein